MTTVKYIATTSVKVAMGLGGNLYAFSHMQSPLRRFCRDIGKSPNAVAWSDKHRVYFVRMKAKHHKLRALATGRRVPNLWWED